MNRVFEPVMIRNLELKNRLMMSAMVTNYSTEAGEVTPRLVAYHQERAKGGVAMIETEAAYVHPGGKGYVHQLGIYSDDLVPGLKWLIRVIHAHGAKVMVQLFHAGRRTSRAMTGYDVVVPSAVAYFEGDKPPEEISGRTDLGSDLLKELTPEEISNLVVLFAQAAARAKKAGCDAVSIHAAHGYLINYFLSPFTNKRKDSYGGNLERRCRFLLEIIAAVRSQVGDLPIVVKISGDEFIPGGLTLNDTKEIAARLEKAGVDGITVSAGTFNPVQERYPIAKPTYAFLRSLPMYTPRGSYLSLAQGIKERVRIPVIAVGRLSTPSFLHDLIEKGRADILALGRALLADPDLPHKMQEGREDEARICIACNQGCFAYLAKQQPITCAIHPKVGREEEFQSKFPVKPKKILIVGGGPAGMTAAQVLSLGGHEVILVEANHQLGGQLKVASKAPHREEIETHLQYLLREVERLPVRILTGTEGNGGLVQDLKPDIVILATGARPWIPEWVEYPGGAFVTAEEVLSQSREVGRSVIVAGGGLVGCEVAELLGEQGKKVTLVEMLPEILRDEFLDIKRYFNNVFAKYQIRVLTGTSISRIRGNTVIIKKNSTDVETLQADHIVLALGYSSRAQDERLIPSGSSVEVFSIGDCVKPRKFLDAVFEAYQLAFSLI